MAPVKPLSDSQFVYQFFVNVGTCQGSSFTFYLIYNTQYIRWTLSVVYDQTFPVKVLAHLSAMSQKAALTSAVYSISLSTLYSNENGNVAMAFYYHVSIPDLAFNDLPWRRTTGSVSISMFYFYYIQITVVQIAQSVLNQVEAMIIKNCFQ